MEEAPQIITFHRKKKKDAAIAPPKSAITPKAAAGTMQPPLLTPEQGQEAKMTRQTYAITTAAAPQEMIPARWRRNRGPMNAKQRHAAEQQAYLAEMKAHFEEVDSFELAVETPTPPGKTATARHPNATTTTTAGWGADKPRAMSLGLSRRSAVAVPRLSVLSSSSLPSPSPLRISLGPRTSLLHSISEAGGPSLLPSLQLQNTVINFGGGAEKTQFSASLRKVARSSSSGASGIIIMDKENDSEQPGSIEPQRRSSVMSAGTGPAAVSRRSSAGASGSSAAATHMFSRLSLRISDAFGKLSRRSELPELPEDSAAEQEEEEEDVQPVMTATATEEHSIQAAIQEKAVNEAAEEEEEEEGKTPQRQGMFTISEEAEGAAPLSTPPAATGKTETAEEDGEEASSLGQDMQTALNVVDAVSPDFSDLSPLGQLLRLCGQETDVSSIPSMEKLLGQHVDFSKVKKIGEGTFGEAFKAGNLVLKIVPMEGTLLVNGEPQKRSEEILAEVAITLTLSGLRPTSERETESENNGITTGIKSNSTAGFVETHGVGICKGRYAKALCKEWHRWDEHNGSENDPVDIFQKDQLFVAFVVADGGLDLEHFEPRSFAELQSILMQVTMTLAVAEEACEFEHRDLHWGNLLISRDGTESVPYRFRDVDVIVDAVGVRVTLIDFTLSRLRTPEGEVAFCDLAADPELFNGPKGDSQAETYRRMQKATKNDWQLYTPITNAFWLRYLADIILSNKMPPACSGEDRLRLKNFRKSAATAATSGELVWHELFAGKWETEAAAA